MKRTATALMGLIFWLAFTPLCVLVVALLPLPIFLYWARIGNLRNAVYRIGKAEDQLLNAALLGGNPKETISSHVGRWVLKRRPDVGRRWMFVFVERITNAFEPDHCVKAVEAPFLAANEPI